MHDAGNRVISKLTDYFAGIVKNKAYCLLKFHHIQLYYRPYCTSNIITPIKAIYTVEPWEKQKLLNSDMLHKYIMYDFKMHHLTNQVREVARHPLKVTPLF